jgi:hypothetical protein
MGHPESVTRKGKVNYRYRGSVSGAESSSE